MLRTEPRRLAQPSYGGDALHVRIDESLNGVSSTECGVLYVFGG